ncbi:unnamed protein product [Adineta ricciae]|uniref:non-specific serine/threonine protein kinase n=2 Tax=Adineta ricciae TaxID=249248 RepID=A0A815KCL4_ADIRI|nr:unnamed protein product [Adineta ricciae]
MVFRGAATFIVRLSRTLISRPAKPIFTSSIHQTSKFTKHPTRFYLFPSIYRSFLAPTNAQNVSSNLVPFRLALDDIKRRLFFAAPRGSHLLLGLLGYSLLPQSSYDQCHFDKTLHQIGNLLSKSSMMDQFSQEDEKHYQTVLDNYELGRLIGCGCNAAVYEARLRSSNSQSNESDIEILSQHSSNSTDGESFTEVQCQTSTCMTDSCSTNSDILPAGRFNLAIKMLFNYGVRSNAEVIKKAMDKELIPLRQYFSHPNIVRMYSCFVDSFPLLNEAHEHYPMAIPTRLSPDGYGRNKTLFIVMRRYDLTLNEYIRSHQPDVHQRLTLFAQLLEALVYLHKQSIVHRDLKSDNLLICESTGELVVADFGCALYQPPDLKVPHQTDEICKGGNLALMAPEILNSEPGPKNYLDFDKSDLWASGTLCYEFFSQPNPFFHGTLRQDTYDDQNLPSLASPPIIERLVHSMLFKNPENRPSAVLVANCLQLYLWFKSLKSTNELCQVYMWTALETLFSKHTLTRVELNLKKLFFERQTSQTLFRAHTFLNQL